ncbi:MAG: hypothetical protein AB7D29_07620 [Campylobacterales bacterium]
MIPVRQTKFGVPHGNCFSACVASMLEMDISEVPDFVPQYGDQWLEHFREWLVPKGLDYFETWPKDIIEYLPKGHMIATGKSPRGDFNHCVIVKTSEPHENLDLVWIHDPHPDNTFLESITWVGFFIKISN